MKLSTMREKVTVIQVRWEDEVVDVGYFPAAMTPALVEQVQEAAKADNLDVMGSMLSPLLAWWDVLDDNDQRIPTDPETIKTLPMAWSMKVLEAVQGHMMPEGSRG